MNSIRDLPWRLVLQLARRDVVLGIDVRVALSSGDASSELLARTHDALQLIQTHAAVTLSRIRADVRHILFADVRGGRYMPSLRTCLIGEKFAIRAVPLELAMMIVHEGMHARLWQTGFTYAQPLRERIERLCVGAEVAFAERVVGSEALVETAKRRLEMRWWEQDVADDLDGAELAERGVPSWVMRAVRLARRIHFG